MTDLSEISASHFARLMTDFLAGAIPAREYQRRMFDAMNRRCAMTDDEFSIIGLAYHDADDYDPEVRLEHTIEEPELRRRVAESLDELKALGVQAGP
jgi:hypothetical protein